MLPTQPPMSPAQPVQSLAPPPAHGFTSVHFHVHLHGGGGAVRVGVADRALSPAAVEAVAVAAEAAAAAWRRCMASQDGNDKRGGKG